MRAAASKSDKTTNIRGQRGRWRSRFRSPLIHSPALLYPFNLQERLPMGKKRVASIQKIPMKNQNL
jgi:hypothetical protein